MEIFKVASQIAQTPIQQEMGTATPRGIERTQINNDNTNSSAPKTTAQINAQNAEQIQKEQLDKAIEDLNKYVTNFDENLRFGYYEPLNTLTVSLVNIKSGDVVRQFPSNEILKMRENFANAIKDLFSKQDFFANGLLLNETK